MNVLRITTRIYPDTGGPAKQAYLLSDFCSRNNIKTSVIACKPKNFYQPKKIINSNFTIHYLPFTAPGINSSFFKQLIFFLKFSIFGLSKALKIIRKEKISIIHGHSPTPTGLLVYLLSKMFKIPYLYSIHGLDYPNSFSLNLEMKLTVKNSAKTITVNRGIRDYIRENFDINNIMWFPNSIDLSNFFHANSKKEKRSIIQNSNLNLFLDENDYIISYIGHMIFLQKVHGMIDFLKAFGKFIENYSLQEQSRLKLIFVGDGTYSNLLKTEVKKLKLEKNVFLIGVRNDIDKILAISDVLGLTSYIEGFPNVILEAMASKVPCIVSNVGEIKHMISENGFIVDPGEISTIQACLDTCYSFPENKRKELMERVAHYVKDNFDIEIVGQKVIKLYLDTLKQSDQN